MSSDVVFSVENKAVSKFTDYATQEVFTQYVTFGFEYNSVTYESQTLVKIYKTGRIITVKIDPFVISAENGVIISNWPNGISTDIGVIPESYRPVTDSVIGIMRWLDSGTPNGIGIIGTFTITNNGSINADINNGQQYVMTSDSLYIGGQAYSYATNISYIV